MSLLPKQHEKNLNLILKISNQFKNRTFDTYDSDDIAQEAFLMACDALTRYTGDPDDQESLTRFLRVHIKNRLLTLRRLKYEKIEKVGPICEFNERQYFPEEKTDWTEYTSQIEQEIPAYLREDYLKYRAGVQCKKNEVEEAIRGIVEAKGWLDG